MTREEVVRCAICGEPMMGWCESETTRLPCCGIPSHAEILNAVCYVGDLRKEKHDALAEKSTAPVPAVPPDDDAMVEQVAKAIRVAVGTDWPWSKVTARAAISAMRENGWGPRKTDPELREKMRKMLDEMFDEPELSRMAKATSMWRENIREYLKHELCVRILSLLGGSNV